MRRTHTTGLSEREIRQLKFEEAHRAYLRQLGRLEQKLHELTYAVDQMTASDLGFYEYETDRVIRVLEENSDEDQEC